MDLVLTVSCYYYCLLDSGPDDPISQPSNRGNKLRENANNVREGALGYVNYEQSYKQVGPFLVLPGCCLRRIQRTDDDRWT